MNYAAIQSIGKIKTAVLKKVKNLFCILTILNISNPEWFTIAASLLFFKNCEAVLDLY